MIHIESLLSARLFLSPQWVGSRVYFLSNLSGKISLYVMDDQGSVPEPLLPPDIALQNPELIGGFSYYVFPTLGKILVMLDHNGDENYKPTLIPLEGGYPEPLFPEAFADARVFFLDVDENQQVVYLAAASHSSANNITYRANLADGRLETLAESTFGKFVADKSRDHSRVLLAEGYTQGDVVLLLWEQGKGERLLYGTPIEQRKEGVHYPLTGFGSAQFSPDESGVLVTTALFTDTYSIAYLDLAHPGELRPVTITGTAHSGSGEMEALIHGRDQRYRVQYNIDGCTWLYEGTFDATRLTLALDTVICGKDALVNGVLKAHHYDKHNDRYALSFCTATTPTQLYTRAHGHTARVTRERLLGIAEAWLSAGEDASFESHDGLRVSARLYLPAPELGYQGARPLVYYVHGGPQGQERPNFAWFSMPLIQYLTLNGFAVFVPNARGSTGYGLSYTKHVDRDWGGKDRLDHVYALKLLAGDARVDVARAGVVGRSYGGYMTLTLAGRHPELWSAAVDMFGPYDLFSFLDRMPETWKPYFHMALGHPEHDREFLTDRSPSTHIMNMRCPLLVIQGKNDPRVVEQESRDVVERLRNAGKTVDYLMFEDEGHDVLKFANRVTCYTAITDFFRQWLKP